MVLGTLIGIGRLAPHVLLRGICTAYVELLRNVPLLVQLLMLAFAIANLLPDPTEPVRLLPGVWLSKGGLSVPWPASGEGGWWPTHFDWPERGDFGVSGGAALSPEYVTIVAGLSFTRPRSWPRSCAPASSRCRRGRCLRAKRWDSRRYSSCAS